MLDKNNYEKHGLPKKEGHCFRNDEKRLHALILISEFEAQYRIVVDGYETIKREEVIKEIRIPIPVNNWENSHLIFKAQKYLNYYGIKAGHADGVLGEITKNAIKKYQKNKSIQQSGIPSNHLVGILAGQYFSRTRKQRLDDWELTAQELDNLYGY